MAFKMLLLLKQYQLLGILVPNYPKLRATGKKLELVIKKIIYGRPWALSLS